MMASTPDHDGFELIEHEDLFKQLLEEEPSTLPQILTWLSPTDYDSSTSEFKRHLSSQAEGTGEWIRETTQFKRWHSSSEHGSIWIKAVPGAGKSVVAASMVNSLASKESVPVLFFFFRQIIEKNRTARSLVCDWLAQLCSYSHSLQYTLWQLIQAKKPLEEVPINQLWQYLEQTLNRLDRAYCIIDALDEMDIDEAFLKRINSLGVFKPSSIKILLTSRPKQYLQQALRDPSVIHVSLEEELVKRDILVFVKQRSETFTSLGDKTREDLVKTICKRSEGLFLYARLMLDQVSDSIDAGLQDEHAIREMVSLLPVGLEDMYNKILRDSRTSCGIVEELQVLILEMVVFSTRPMRLIEVARAIEISTLSKSIFQGSKAIVRSACGPLLEIVENEIVQILHHSFTEFLLDSSRIAKSSKQSSQFPTLNARPAHRNIALICLDTLQSQLFDDYPEEPLPDLSGTFDYYDDNEIFKDTTLLTPYFLKSPFAQYASSNWPYHVRTYSADDEAIYKRLQRFCDPTSRPFRAWLYGQNLDNTSRVHGARVAHLHIAAGYGLTNYARRLIIESANVDATDRQGSTPLHWAALNGHHEVAELLISAGAAPDQDRVDGLKPLHIAARRNHAKVVKILLEASVSVRTPKLREYPGRRCGNAPTTIGETPLDYAGQKETILEMLPYTNTDDRQSLLFTAARSGNHEVLALLLEQYEFDLEEVSGNQEYLLTLAVGSSSESCVKLLLDKGANPKVLTQHAKKYSTYDAPEISLRNVLHKLAIHSAQDNKDTIPILHMLVNAGADINARDGEGRTPFHILFDQAEFSPTRPKLALVEAFLANGADPNILTDGGESSLHLACRMTADASFTDLLLQHGADPNLPQTSDGSTPVHCAVRCIFNCEHLRILLSSGAKATVQDSKGRTPLHIACEQSHSHVHEDLKLLIEHGADPNVCDQDGRTCLYNFPSNQYNQIKEIVSIIFEAGLDPNTRDRDGFSLLHHVSKKTWAAEDKLLHTLLQQTNCPSLSIQTIPDRKSPLHITCQTREPWKNFQILIAAGANPLDVDHHGNTLLHEIAAHFTTGADQVRLVEELIRLGLSPKATNWKQQTALHIMPRTNLCSRSTKDSMATLLLRLDPGLDINARDCDQYTPLHYAAAVSDLLTFHLIELGADCTAKSRTLRTPLHCAARARNSGCLALLAESSNASKLSIEIDAQDVDGSTPLHDACRSGRQESVSILLKAGAKVADFSLSYFEACIAANGEDKIWYARRNHQGTADSPVTDPFRPTFVEDHSQYNRVTNQRLLPIRTDEISVLLLDAIGDLSIHSTLLSQVIRRAIQVKDKEMLSALHDRMLLISTSHQHLWTVRTLDYIDEVGLTIDQPKAVKISDGRYSRSFLADLSIADLKGLQQQGLDFTNYENMSCYTTQVAGLVESGLVGRITILHHLVKSLDEEMAQQGAVNKFKEERYNSADLLKPLLHVACSRSFWNLDMLRLLVEKIQVDVNIYHWKFSPQDWQGKQDLIRGPAALHLLAQGTHRWNISATQYLLEHGADVDALDENGWTPICVASNSRKDDTEGFYGPQICEVLLAAGANANFSTPDGSTPLTLASANTHVIEILLENGGLLSSQGKQPLIAAVEAADTDVLHCYLKHGADCNLLYTGKDLKFHDNSCSSAAYEQGDCYPMLLVALNLAKSTENLLRTALDMARLMLQHGARLDLPIETCNTLMIHHLFEHATPPFLDLILETDFDPNLRDQRGRTVFLAACMSHRYEINENTRPVMDKRYDGFDYTHAQLKLAKHPKYASQIDYLASDTNGQHMLMHSLSRWSEEFKQDFLSIPGVADLVHQKDDAGVSPLHLAFARGKYEIALDLVESYGANILEPSPSGDTVFHHCLETFAEMQMYLKMITAMDETGSELEVDEKNALNGYEAKYNARIKLIEDHYLARGGNPNAQNNAGRTALMQYLAAQKSEDDWDEDDEDSIANDFPILEKWGVNFIDFVDNEGQGPLHIVAKRSTGQGWYARKDDQGYNKALFKMLLDKGCDPLKEDNAGLTSLDVAAASGNKAILSLFDRQA